METIRKAIREKNVINIIYEGHSRTVEPHLLGENTKGNIALRAYQTGGYSSSGTLDWKMYLYSKITSIEVTSVHFKIREGYNPNDTGMKRILERV